MGRPGHRRWVPAAAGRGAKGPGVPAGRWSLALLAALGAGCAPSAGPPARTSHALAPTTTATPPAPAPTAPPPSPPYGLGFVQLDLVDPSRLVYPPHSGTSGPVPRQLDTGVWYPAAGPVGAGPVPGATPLRQAGPWPLVVFAPGYDVTYQPYLPLLEAWARAGYVVAAPVFPLTNPSTPGGPDESDLVNEPGDLAFVVGQLLARSAAPADPLHGTLDPARVAVAGQSDGAIAALAVAYDTCCRDPAVRAALVFAGEEEVLGPGSYFAAGGPPLLAAQGTADTINPPAYSYQLYQDAPHPKYLLVLEGADHLGPFSDSPAYEPIVARTSTDFLDAYLDGDQAALARLATDASPPSLARLSGP
jgi:dienelactone hydrolase